MKNLSFTCFLGHFILPLVLRVANPLVENFSFLAGFATLLVLGSMIEVNMIFRSDSRIPLPVLSSTGG